MINPKQASTKSTVAAPSHLVDLHALFLPYGPIYSIHIPLETNTNDANVTNNREEPSPKIELSTKITIPNPRIRVHLDPITGKGRSKGYGFLELNTHQFEKLAPRKKRKVDKVYKLKKDVKEKDLKDELCEKVQARSECWFCQKRKELIVDDADKVVAQTDLLRAEPGPTASTISAGHLPSSLLRHVPVCGTSAASCSTAWTQNDTNQSVSVVHRQAVYIDDSKPDSHKHSSRASAPSAFTLSESWVEDDLAHLLETLYIINDNDPTGPSCFNKRLDILDILYFL
ncbi:hypothetical protein F5051DRAFT_447493 [Lentinula edodes]|nr:hypothetical protein F5051DRAFT_447493 [Lentinula edodes]